MSLPLQILSRYDQIFCRYRINIVSSFADTLPSKVDATDRTQILKEVCESLHLYEYGKYYSHLDSIFDVHPQVQPLTDKVDVTGGNCRSEQLLSNCRSTTSAIDLLKKLRLVFL